MKTLKKLSAIAIFSFAVLLSSCDPGFDDTYKVKNGLDRDVKLTQGSVYGTNENVTPSDTIIIKPDETKEVYQEGGIGISPFDGKVQNIDYILYEEYRPYIIFDDSIDYKILDYSNEGIIKTFEKSIFKKSCWEILSRNENDNVHEVFYTITEEDYQNAVVLNKCEPKPDVEINGYSVTECLEKDRGLMYYDNDTIYVTAINDSSLMIKTTSTLFNCCSEEFFVDAYWYENKIRISMFEIEDEELACDCVCPRSVEFVLSNLEIGETYNIVLSKNLNGKYFSFEVVFERDTDLMFIRS